MIACHCGMRFAGRDARDAHAPDGRCLIADEMHAPPWRWTNDGWTLTPTGEPVRPITTQQITTPAPARPGLRDIAAALAADLVQMHDAEAIDLDRWPNAKALVDALAPDAA